MADTIEKNVTRGGQFLVKETKCEDIFTPEDFSEEQLMMRDSVKEFVDKEICLTKIVLRKKITHLLRKACVKLVNWDF